MTLVFVSVLFTWTLVRLNIYFYEESMRFWIWITDHKFFVWKWSAQVQKIQGAPNRINQRQSTPRHILIKLTKIKHKEQILKAAREKQQITHKGIPIRITADLSIETLHARREWQDILKVMKENKLQPRLLYPVMISFKYEGKIKSFTDKQKLRKLSSTKPALQQILKDLL